MQWYAFAHGIWLCLQKNVIRNDNEKPRPKHTQMYRMKMNTGRKVLSGAIAREIADIVHHDKIERNTCIAYGFAVVVGAIIYYIGDV